MEGTLSLEHLEQIQFGSKNSMGPIQETNKELTRACASISLGLKTFALGGSEGRRREMNSQDNSGYV